MSGSARPAARWSAYLAVAVLFAVACAFLSNWQFTRNEERGRQLALVEANFDAAPVPIGAVVRGTGEWDPDDEWRPVVLEGGYLVDEQLLVRNRPHGGTSAFEVLVPFRLDDGRILVVDRGWVPPADDGPEPAAVPAPRAGASTVVVRLRPGEAAPSSGRSAPPGQVPTIALDLIAGALPEREVITAVYGVMVAEDPAPATRPQPLPVPSEDPGPHLSYAIQWILFAIMGFVFIGYVIRTEVRHARDDGPSRPARRRDRDMQDEDAILDAEPAGDVPAGERAHASATRSA